MLYRDNKLTYDGEVPVLLLGVEGGLGLGDLAPVPPAGGQLGVHQAQRVLPALQVRPELRPNIQVCFEYISSFS